jgi:hypothetical protein
MNLQVDGHNIPKYTCTDESALTNYTKVIPLEQCGPTKDPRKRTVPKPTIYKLKLKEMDITPTSYTSYKNDNYDVPQLRENPINIPLEPTTQLWDPREKSFMDLLMSDMNPDQILAEMNIQPTPDVTVTRKRPTIPDISTDKLFQDLSEIMSKNHNINVEDDLKQSYPEFEEMISKQSFFSTEDTQTDTTQTMLKELCEMRPEINTEVSNQDDFVTLSIEELEDDETWLTLDSMGLTTPLENLIPPEDFMNI